MRVLGIDPGTFQMGIGIVEGGGGAYQLLTFETVRISKKLSSPERLKEVYEAVGEAIERFSPSVLAVENVFFGKNVQSLVRIGEARACVLLAAAGRGVSVVEYPPARIKQSICGNGQASKFQVQQMVRRLLRMKIAPPTDAADALAVALCHFHSQNVRVPVG